MMYTMKLQCTQHRSSAYTQWTRSTQNFTHTLNTHSFFLGLKIILIRLWHKGLELSIYWKFPLHKDKCTAIFKMNILCCFSTRGWSLLLCWFDQIHVRGLNEETQRWSAVRCLEHLFSLVSIREVCLRAPLNDLTISIANEALSRHHKDLFDLPVPLAEWGCYYWTPFIISCDYIWILFALFSLLVSLPATTQVVFPQARAYLNDQYSVVCGEHPSLQHHISIVS